MRRAIITLATTAAGVAALLSFKTHSVADASAAVTTPSTSASTPAAASSPAAGSKQKSGSKKSGSKQKSGSSPAASSAAGGTTTTRMVTGTVANGPYGPTQVQLVLDGKKITKVNVLQHTDDGSMSVQIDSNALPKLTSETLTAQSARIDAVSGATYTSQGYIQSLQSALDAA